MRAARSLAAALAAVALAACGPAVDGDATSRAAITNGQLDGDGHPYVGTIAVRQASGAWRQFCSGSLVSPNVYLTAGHCIVDRILGPGLAHGDYGVAFDAVFTPTSEVVTGTAWLHPMFPGVDIGVIVLDEARPELGVAALPATGLLDELSRSQELVGQRFTIVGYGDTVAGPQGSTFIGRGVRRVGTVEFDAIVPFLGDGVFPGGFVQVRMDPVGDDSGVCYQDSGGPNLFEGTNEIAAITRATPVRSCRAVAWSQRVDIPEAVAFPAQFL